MAIESQRALRYVRSGLFPSPSIDGLSSALDIPDLGESRQGSEIAGTRYLVTDAARVVKARAVPQRRGGTLYAIDEIANPTAVYFAPGGLYADRCLISGQIIAVGDPRSLELYRAFKGRVLRGFEKIKTVYVGPEAAAMLDRGARLAQNVGAPSEYDLTRD